MRTIIFLIVSLLVPLGMWASGCSQETSRASMPKGPEMERLARAPGQSVDDAIARPPTVPALIDPEILATPDQPTFARIRAVMDREATLSARHNEPGLFVLPRQEYPEMAIVPDSFAQPAPASIQPVPAFTQPAPVQYAAAQQSNSFWSSPAPGMYDMPVTSHDIPADISAMVPSAPMPASPMPMPVQPRAIAPLAPLPVLPVLPETIPGVLTGYDIIEPARPQASVPEPAGALSPSIPDLFGDPSFGFLAPLGALEDLAGVMAANAEREVAAQLRKTAPIAEPMDAVKPLSPLPEPPAAPAVEMAQTEEAQSPAKALDISGLLASIGPREPVSEPVPETAAPIAAPASNALAAATPPPAAITPEPLPVMPDFGEVRPPELLKDETLAARPAAKATQAGDEGRGAVDSAINNTWETYKPPTRADRQTPYTALDPLIDYDFSAFAKKEEKAPAQEATAKAAAPAKKIAADPVREPEAPPLAF